MAKHDYRIYSRLREPGSSPSVDREKFGQIIDEAINSMRPEQRNLLPLLKLEELKTTAEEVSALSWKCKGSCGCPMTAVGAVNVVPSNSSICGETSGDAPDHYKHAVESFAGKFDNIISRELNIGGTHGVIVRISD